MTSQRQPNGNSKPQSDIESGHFLSCHIFTKSNNPADSKTCIELHANLWKTSLSGSEFYLDLGVMLESPVETIYFYVPFDIDPSRGDWEDLGSKIFNSDKQNACRLISAIFNEDCKIDYGEKNNHYVSLIRNQSEVFKKFNFISLDRTDISVGKYGMGSLIEIPLSSNKYEMCENRLYFRFRLRIRNSDRLILTQSITNDIIQAVFSHMDIIDVRINETRNLDHEIRSLMIKEKCKSASFSKIHFLYVADIRVNVESEDIQNYDRRMIEATIWDGYEPENIGKGQLIAHHWSLKSKKHRNINTSNRFCNIINNLLTRIGKDDDKETSGLNEYRLFFTTKYPKIDIFKYLAYCSVVVLLGAAGSFLASASENPIPNCKLGILLAIFLYSVSVFILDRKK